MSAKHFCLKWNNFQNNILNAFKSLHTTEELTDVTLTCEGINLKAHKCILSACSPYFRTVFKENPCSHPIVILKDVFYIDLIAIVNFMYHGEVLVAEEQLSSFLQTAKLLQVSGLNTTESPKKIKRDIEESPVKRARTSKVFSPNSDSEENTKNDFIDYNEDKCDVNDNVEDKTDQSILGAALVVRTDAKPGSILERSLTVAAKSPSGPSYPVTDQLQIIPDIPKSVFIPRKPPEMSPLAKDSDYLAQQTIKIEEETNDGDLSSEETRESINFQRNLDVIQQPHHSSQCGNCPHCGKVYSNQSALKYHVRLVHSDLTNMYCCHLCPESFDYREGYKKHMVEVHFIRN